MILFACWGEGQYDISLSHPVTNSDWLMFSFYKLLTASQIRFVQFIYHSLSRSSKTDLQPKIVCVCVYCKSIIWNRFNHTISYHWCCSDAPGNRKMSACNQNCWCQSAFPVSGKHGSQSILNIDVIVVVNQSRLLELKWLQLNTHLLFNIHHISSPTCQFHHCHIRFLGGVRGKKHPCSS